MYISRHRSGRLSNAWLVPGVSLLFIALLVFLLWNTGRRSKPGNELVVYCATGMVKPVEEAAKEYEQTYGVKIIIESDGSGKLLNSKVRVVKNRGDLFLSADESYILQGQADGLIAESIPVAKIHPGIVTAKGNPKKIAGVRDLLREDIKVALANPENASIGRVTKKALGPSGEWAELERQQRDFRAKVSLVGTVNEVAQAVQVGAADAGIVWDVTARLYDLPLIEVPSLAKFEEQVTIGVLERTEYPQRALHFARFLTARDRGQKYFEKHQYQPLPDADAWAETPTVELYYGAMLRPAIEQTLQEFEQREGVEIKPVANGCGILVSQMQAGKLPSAYFACDRCFLRQVQEDFLPPVSMTENDLVILVAKGNPLRISGLSDLARDDDPARQPEVRVGLAHPEKAALGKLTQQLLERQHLDKKLAASGNLVVDSPTGDYLVNQLLIGALDAVIVYRSNARANPENLQKYVQIVEIPEPGAVAVQPFAIARGSDHKYLMRRLQAAIEAPKSRQRFEQLGFRWLQRREQP